MTMCSFDFNKTITIFIYLCSSVCVCVSPLSGEHNVAFHFQTQKAAFAQNLFGLKALLIGVGTHRFFVDDIPIRTFKNSKDLGVKFPFNQPMKLYSSLWNADDWATRGGLEKTDWSKAPFVASYRGFHIDGCEASVEAKFCATQGKRWWDQKEFQDLDAYQWRRLRWVRSKYTIYNYCTDRSRYPTVPPECKRDRDF